MNTFVAHLRQCAEDAAAVRAFVSGALVYAAIADSLEAEYRRWQLEELTLEQAAAERGESYSALQKAVAAGRLRNIGDKGRPRVRRCDLYRPTSPAAVGPDLAGEVLRVG